MEDGGMGSLGLKGEHRPPSSSLSGYDPGPLDEARSPGNHSGGGTPRLSLPPGRDDLSEAGDASNASVGSGDGSGLDDDDPTGKSKKFQKTGNLSQSCHKHPTCVVISTSDTSISFRRPEETACSGHRTINFT